LLTDGTLGLWSVFSHLCLGNLSFVSKTVSGVAEVIENTVEFRFFEPPREIDIGSKNREFEKSKEASNQTCFTVEWFYKIQEGRQQGYITLVNVRTIFIYQKTYI